MNANAMYVLVMVAALLWSGRAEACRYTKGLDVSFVRYADLVVVGRIRDYSPNGPKTPHYARFSVDVLEVLYGDPPQSFAVIWHNSTFGYPSSMPTEPQLMAFARLKSPHSHKIGSDFRVDSQDASKLLVLREFCGRSFIFPATDSAAAKVRQHLDDARNGR